MVLNQSLPRLSIGSWYLSRRCAVTKVYHTASLIFHCCPYFVLLISFSGSSHLSPRPMSFQEWILCPSAACCPCSSRASVLCRSYRCCHRTNAVVVSWLIVELPLYGSRCQSRFLPLDLTLLRFVTTWRWLWNKHHLYVSSCSLRYQSSGLWFLKRGIWPSLSQKKKLLKILSSLYYIIIFLMKNKTR